MRRSGIPGLLALGLLFPAAAAHAQATPWIVRDDFLGPRQERELLAPGANDTLATPASPS